MSSKSTWLRGMTVVVLALLMAAAAAAQDTVGTLAVSVLGVPSNRGVVRFAVYGDQSAFDARSTRPELEGDCPIVENRCEFALPNVPNGEYAVMVYHDENMNGEYDWGLFERERVGVSNYTSRLWSSPDYVTARFPHRGPRTVVEIRVY